MTGWAGWLARWAFFHAFMPSRRTALATIRDWLAIPRHGRHLPAPATDDARPIGAHALAA